MIWLTRKSTLIWNWNGLGFVLQKLYHLIIDRSVVSSKKESTEKKNFLYVHFCDTYTTWKCFCILRRILDCLKQKRPQKFDIDFLICFWLYQVCTGKSLSDALILGSTNQQYDKRLFIDLQVQYIHTWKLQSQIMFCISCIVESRSACYYSENQKFCF